MHANRHAFSYVRALLLFASALLLALVVTAGWAFHWALNATPVIAVDFGARVRELAVTKQDLTAPNEFNAIVRVGATLHALEVEVWDKYGEPGNAGGSIPEGWDERFFFPLDYYALEVDDAPELPRSIAREYMAKALASSVPGDLKRVRNARHLQRPKRDGAIMFSLCPELGQCRAAARFCKARGAMAAKAGDWGNFVDAYADMRGLSRAADRDPMLISHLVGLAIDSLAAGSVRDRVAKYDVPPNTLVELQSLFAGNGWRQPWPIVVEAERMSFLDFCQRGHDEVGRRIPSAIRRIDDPATQWSGSAESGRLTDLAALFLPRRAEIEAVANRVYDRIKEVVTMPRAKRRGDLSVLVDVDIPPDHLISMEQVSAIGKSVAASDQLSQSLHATQIAIALERCRLARGKYPENLGELVPEFLPGVPEDPYSEHGFVYKRGDDPAAKGNYTLYSVGDDGEDNGGLRAEHEQDALVSAGKGTDFVFMPPASK